MRIISSTVIVLVVGCSAPMPPSTTPGPSDPTVPVTKNDRSVNAGTAASTQPSNQETSSMPENDLSKNGADSDDGLTSDDSGGDSTTGSEQAELTIGLLSLARAIPAAEMPEFLRQRADGESSTVSLTDLKALEGDAREKVLQALDRAVSYYQRAARKHRVRANPDQRIADRIEAFVSAARE